VKKYRFIDHSGDAAVVVEGGTLEELFQHAAESFFYVITEPANIEGVESRSVSLHAPGLEELLVDWLNEFLYLFDTRSLLFGRFDIKRLDEQHLDAVVWGEEYDKEKHPIKTTIKAVTFHQLRVEKKDGKWEAQIIFDL
jgi:SHS2 domain-containing protein